MLFLKYIKLSFLFESALIMFSSIVFGIMIGYVFNRTTKHRGVWHSIFMAILGCILIYFFNYSNVIHFYSPHIIKLIIPINTPKIPTITHNAVGVK